MVIVHNWRKEQGVIDMKNNGAGAYFSPQIYISAPSLNPDNGPASESWMLSLKRPLLGKDLRNIHLCKGGL